MKCPKCKNPECVKNGNARNKQRFLCKACNFQFLEINEEANNKLDKKRHALILFIQGYSYRSIANWLGVGHTLIFFWIKKWEAVLSELKKNNEPQYVSLSEMKNMLQSKEQVKNYKFILLDVETDLAFVSQLSIEKMNPKEIMEINT